MPIKEGQHRFPHLRIQRRRRIVIQINHRSVPHSTVLPPPASLRGNQFPTAITVFNAKGHR
jgi:hypothetical protein